MSKPGRPLALWFIVVFLGLATVLLLMGQTMAIFDYDLAVGMGLQESREEVGEHGVEVNRAFGAGDTVVYVPLMLVSLVGLLLRKRWSLLTTAAVAGISAYWTVTNGLMLLFLPGVPGYAYSPGPEIWLFIVSFLLFGVWCLFYLLFRGDELLR